MAQPESFPIPAQGFYNPDRGRKVTLQCREHPDAARYRTKDPMISTWFAASDGEDCGCQIGNYDVVGREERG